VVFRETLRIQTRGRGFAAVTSHVAKIVEKSGITTGLCNVFIHHTSASVVISENADPAVRRDLERFMQHIAPDGGSGYEHDTEGPDDMPAHIRSVLTETTLSIPVGERRLMLGTWQGIYVWEHRMEAQTRELTITVMGD
jgi:secondary thiamine-phosphate synthase enzyme